MPVHMGSSGYQKGDRHFVFTKRLSPFSLFRDEVYLTIGLSLRII